MKTFLAMTIGTLALLCTAAMAAEMEGTVKEVDAMKHMRLAVPGLQILDRE